MDLGTIASKIALRINRPDKIDQVVDAINDAIEFASVNGDFADDLTEGSVAVDSALYAQSLVVSTTFTRYRKIKYLLPSGYKKNLRWQDPSRVFDQSGNADNDIWYRAGDSIVFKLSTLVSLMYYGYYSFPDRLEDDADTHWMLDNMYSVIFNLAIADMWDNIGNAEEGTKARAKGNLFLISHRRDHQDGAAHS